MHAFWHGCAFTRSESEVNQPAIPICRSVGCCYQKARETGIVFFTRCRSHERLVYLLSALWAVTLGIYTEIKSKGVVL